MAEVGVHRVRLARLDAHQRQSVFRPDAVSGIAPTRGSASAGSSTVIDKDNATVPRHRFGG